MLLAERHQETLVLGVEVFLDEQQRLPIYRVLGHALASKRAGLWGWRRPPSIGEQLPQMEVKLAELPAVVAGGDGQHAAAGRGPHSGGHRAADGRFADAVDHDLQCAVRVRMELAGYSAAERRAIAVRR